MKRIFIFALLLLTFRVSATTIQISASSLNTYFNGLGYQSFEITGNSFSAGGYVSFYNSGSGITYYCFTNGQYASPYLSGNQYEFTTNLTVDVTLDTSISETDPSGNNLTLLCPPFVDGSIYDVTPGVGLIPETSGSGSSSTVTIDNTSSNAVPVTLGSPSDAVPWFFQGLEYGSGLAALLFGIISVRRALGLGDSWD